MKNHYQEWRKRLLQINNEYPFGPIQTFHNEEGQIHCDDGPAVITPTRCIWYRNGRKHGWDVDIFGNKQTFYENTFVPSHFITFPEAITFKEIFRHTNAEVRSIAVRIYGLDRLLEEEKLAIIHQDKKTGAELLSIKIIEGNNLDDTLYYVKVYNSTPEIDGNRKVYFLAVPPGMKTCRQAVAWTFGVDEEEYAPQQET